MAEAINQMDRLTVNLHLTERCNFACTYCFARWDRSDEIFADKKKFSQFLRFIEEQARLGLGVKHLTLNFAGGEPALFRHLETGVEQCRALGINTSVITNGLLFRRLSVEKVAELFNIVGVSVDSLNPAINKLCGRVDRRGVGTDYEEVKQGLRLLKRIKPEIITKINTVVSSLNYKEVIKPYVDSCGVNRWKILRVLPLAGTTSISSEEFSVFLNINAGHPGSIVEDNSDMLRSYVMINSNGHLYQSSEVAGSIVYKYFDLKDGGLFEGLRRIGFDVSKYRRRYRAEGGFKGFENSSEGIRFKSAPQSKATAT